MRVLVIEDDRFFREFYTLKLQENGFESSNASDGEEGLAKIRAQKPDVILLDLVMPKVDGFSVLETLQKDPVLKSIPVLVFSTLGQEKDVQRALTLGAKGYVNKTFFDFDNLLTHIKQILAPASVSN